MKKFFALLLSGTLCGTALFGAAACKQNTEGYSVYAPDGAPALAMVNAIAQDDKTFDYHVIDANTVTAQVTGENPAADFCVLPVNAASKVLGNGQTYQMLGTVTNGNLYFLTTGTNAALTEDNLAEVLIGKTVGVVQLTNVPGLTLQAVLKDHTIDYQIVGNDGTADENKVNLKAMEAANVTPAGGCDYYLCPEPIASTKIKATSAAPKPFVLAGDLQQLYGEDAGYPQAVLVAKKSVIQSDKAAVNKLVGYFADAAEYLKTVRTEDVLTLLDEHRTEGLDASFNANNLTAEVVANCSVYFTAAKDCKAKVNEFLAKLIAVNANAAAAVSDAFYYEG